MARVTNGMITYDDANYMIANEGFTLTGTYTTGLNCMNRAELEAYMNVDTSYFSAYANNRLVPYNLLVAVAAGDTTPPVFTTDLYVTSFTDTTISVAWAVTDDVGVVSQNVIVSDGGGNHSIGSTATSYTITGLTPNTAYNIYIFAGDAASNYAASNTITQVTSVADNPPSVPTGLAETADSITTISMSWNASTDDNGVLRYEIDINGSGTPINTGADLTHILSGLTYNTTYGIRVRAVDTIEQASAWSSTVNMATAADTTAPSQVTGVAASVGDTQSIITWNASTDNVGVTQYKIIMSTGDTSPAQSYTAYSTSLTYTFSGLTNGASYSVNVYARDAAGNWSIASTTVYVTPVVADTTPPVFTSALSLVSNTATSLSLSWASTDNVGVDSQVLWWQEYGTSTWSQTTLNSQATSYTLSGLNASTQYTIYVEASDAASNSTSSYLTTTTDTGTADTTNPVFTTYPYVSAVTQGSISIDWVSTDNVGVTSQTLWWKISGGSWTTTPLSASATSYTKTGLTAATSYYYYLEASDAAGNITRTSSTEQTTSFPA